MRSVRLVLAGFFALTLTGSVAYGAEFRAGAGKSEIHVTPNILPIEGYTAVHDQATVRVLILDDGHNRYAFTVLDTPSIGEAVIATAKDALKKEANVPAENAIVFATHATSAPHIGLMGPAPAQAGARSGQAGGGPGGAPGGPGGQGGPGGPGGQGGPAGQANRPPQSPNNQNPEGIMAYRKAYEGAVESAVKQAASSMKPARLGFGVGTTSININRDMPTPKGWIAQGGYAGGVSDKSLPVVRIDGADGKPIAILINAPVRPVALDASKTAPDGGRALSSDLSGATVRYVEKWYGGETVALYVMGAANDQAPVFEAKRSVLNPDGSVSQVDLGPAAFSLLEMLAERLGTEAIQTAEAIKATDQPVIEVIRKTMKVPGQGRSSAATPTSGPVLSYTYPEAGELDFPLLYVRLGEIAMVGIQPEVSTSIGERIKKLSPFPKTMVVTMADGGAKYLVDGPSYDHFTLEARGSQYGRGADDAVIREATGQLKQMKAAAAK